MNGTTNVKKKKTVKKKRGEEHALGGVWMGNFQDPAGLVFQSILFLIFFIPSIIVTGPFLNQEHFVRLPYVIAVTCTLLINLSVKLKSNPENLSWLKTLAPLWWPPLFLPILFIVVICLLTGAQALLAAIAKLFD